MWEARIWEARIWEARICEARKELFSASPFCGGTPILKGHRVVRVGVGVVANKFPGIRAGVCHDHYSAHQGVEHDDMNVICIGSRIIGIELTKVVLQAFLGAVFVPEPRFQRRLDKIMQVEQNGLT